jgi:hypothetical protein
MKLRALLVVMCAALLVVPAAFAETTATMSISGDVETNTTIELQTVEVPGGDDLNSNAWTNDGRTHIAFEGRLEGDTGWFAAALGDAMIATTGSTGVDDAWVQFGTEAFSVKVGRYELNGLFDKGEDVYIASAPAQPARYEGNFWRGRFGGTVDNVGLYFGGLELGFILGGASDDSPIIITETDPNTGQVTTRVVTLPFSVNAYAFRPVYTLSTDRFTFEIGGEYGMYVPQADKISTADYSGDNNYQENRFGGAFNVVGMFGSTSVGISASYGQITGSEIDDSDMNDVTEMAVFGMAKIPVGEANTLGLGVGYSGVEVDKVGDDNKIEAYVSFIQQLPVEGLKIKYAASYAGANLSPDAGSDISNSGFGARIRLNYDF